jgi:hypothetical protein
LGQLAFISRPPGENAAGGRAVVLTGPIIGAMTMVDERRVQVPFLLELDRDAEVKVTFRNIFEGKGTASALSLCNDC